MTRTASPWRPSPTGLGPASDVAAQLRHRIRYGLDLDAIQAALADAIDGYVIRDEVTADQLAALTALAVAEHRARVRVARGCL
jgi:hypothetical protein